MTIAEYLKQKGREEGKQRWLQEGLNEGLQQVSIAKPAASR